MPTTSMGSGRPELPEPPLPVDYDEWSRLPHLQRIKPLVLHWVDHGAQTPLVVIAFYTIKVLVYVVAGIALISLTPHLGQPWEFDDWWREPIVYEKAIVFTMLVEVMGFGGGCGPGNFQFEKPFVAYRYWFRPETIRQPPWPRYVPFTRGDTRTPGDVALFAAFTVSVLVVLLSPGEGSVPTLRLNPVLVAPMVVLLALIGLRDKTIYLAARAEMYWIAAIIFLFPYDDMMIGLQLALLCIWWGAGLSKITHLFPYAVSVMISNAPGRPRWLKRLMYRDVPDDIRPSRAGVLLTHIGSGIELGMPFFLFFADDTLLAVAVAIVVIFHLHIISTVPVGVPNEWNVFMIFGTLFLFWGHREVGPSDLDNPLLIAFLVIALVLPVVVGNIRPDLVSFLPGMRYYAANWACNLWCFRGDSEAKLSNLVRPLGTPKEQLGRMFGPKFTDVTLFTVRAIRSMHPQGRALNGLLTRTFGDRLDEYSVQDGAPLCSSLVGWSFGDGHLHDDRLLASVQKRCNFDEGELVLIILESQPLHQQRQRYRVVDAASGLIEEGYVYTKDMLARQPWLDDDDPTIPVDVIHSRSDA